MFAKHLGQKVGFAELIISKSRKSRQARSRIVGAESGICFTGRLLEEKRTSTPANMIQHKGATFWCSFDVAHFTTFIRFKMDMNRGNVDAFQRHKHVMIKMSLHIHSTFKMHCKLYRIPFARHSSSSL